LGLAAKSPLLIQHPEICWLHTLEKLTAAYNNVTPNPSKPVSLPLEFPAFQCKMSRSFMGCFISTIWF